MTRAPATTAMLRAAFALLGTVLCIAGLFVGCSREPTGGGQLNVGVESEFERLDPLVLRNPKTLLISAQIFEGLLGLDGAGNIVPGLAEKWDTRDGKVWTFALRKNARFHDSWIFGERRSRKVRASDVAWSYTAYCGPGAYGAFVLADIVEGCGGYSAGKAKSVSGLRVVDESTLEIQLVRPEYAFLHRITAPWLSIFPREAAGAGVKDRWGLDTVVGTGPYRLQSRSATDMALVANPEYWDASRRPAIRSLHYRVIVNDQLRLAEFAQQRIDLMQVPGALTAEILERDGTLKGDLAKTANIQVAKTFNSHVLGFNMERVPDAKPASRYQPSSRSACDRLQPPVRQGGCHWWHRSARLARLRAALRHRRPLRRRASEGSARKIELQGRGTRARRTRSGQQRADWLGRATAVEIHRCARSVDQSRLRQRNQQDGQRRIADLQHELRVRLLVTGPDPADAFPFQEAARAQLLAVLAPRDRHQAGWAEFVGRPGGQK